VFCLSWALPVQVQSAFGYLVAWFLLLAAPRDALNARRLQLTYSDSEASGNVYVPGPRIDLSRNRPETPVCTSVADGGG
jgi:hypothetical protein